MTAFLRQVAEHYYALGAEQMSRLCFIFPNRRSLVFCRKYFGQVLSEDPFAKPVKAPQMTTVRDFFYRLCDSTPTPKVRLLLELYACYGDIRAARGLKVEPLDEFVSWGDVILSDFGEIDKYLVDPRSLFRNITELKEIQDDFSDLTEEQVEAIRHFIGHFRREGRLTVNIEGDDPGVKAGFLQTWQMLYPLYQEFNSRLQERGLSYEGQVYRRLAARARESSVVDILGESFPEVDSFVFVGLNALNECEKTVMRRMRDAGVAEFCWDYVSERIRHPRNMSSLFMSRNVQDFPQAFEPVAEDPAVQRFTVLSVPSSVGQAKQLPEIFRSLGAAGGAGADRGALARGDAGADGGAEAAGVPGGAAPGQEFVPGIETAVVLPDEALLIPVLNSIPPGIQDINVTMGYPMTGSAFHALMSDLAALQMHMRRRDGEWYFYHRQLWSLLGNSIVKTILDESEMQKVKEIRSRLEYYVRASDFSGIPVLDRICTPVVTDTSSTGLSSALAAYCLEIISAVSARMLSNGELALELEFARSYYLAVTQLSAEELPVTPQTWFRLLGQMVTAEAVHFRGEPLRGLQIMGPLETRALDFDNLVILSCNEGVFPRHSVASSYIPHELRKAFGLPTYEYQDAVWAYYFYRLIQRARNVWLVYDSRLEGVRNGEESRYIKQLEMHFRVPLNRYVAKASPGTKAQQSSIPKTASDIQAIRDCYLSASALQSYLDCPVRFYYQYIKGLSEPEEVSESLDAGMMGTVFHKVMQTLYTVPGGRLDKALLKALLSDKARIATLVRENICAQMKSFEVRGRNLIFEDILRLYVEKTIQRDLELLEQSAAPCIQIEGLELKKFFEIDGFRFIGVIDRLDSLRPGTLRVVDYKTGSVDEKDLDINDDNAREVVDLLFDHPKGKKWPKIALQLYLYDVLAEQNFPGRRLYNSIYQTSALYVGQVKTVERSARFCELARERLSLLLQEMVDPERDFQLTEDLDRCKYCDFKTICGR